MEVKDGRRIVVMTEENKGKISNLMPILLPRSKMDPNRNEEEGAQGRAMAQWAYHEFHGKIAQVQSDN